MDKYETLIPVADALDYLKELIIEHDLNNIPHKVYQEITPASDLTRFERDMLYMRIGVVAPNLYIGTCLSLLLRMIIGNHWQLLDRSINTDFPEDQLDAGQITGQQICDYIAGREVTQKVLNRDSVLSADIPDHLRYELEEHEVIWKKDKEWLTEAPRSDTILKTELYSSSKGEYTLERKVSDMSLWNLREIKKYYNSLGNLDY